MDRAVKRGTLRKEAIPSRLLGVDEKAFRKGHRYLTIVNDIERGTVEFISENREKASLAEFYKSRTPEQLRAIEAIAMDMWEPYVQATLEWVPLSKDKIVFDKFHVMKKMNEGVDKVRKEEHRALMALGSNTLSKTKYLWLYGEENIPEHRQEEFTALKESTLKTARAWSIKEGAMELQKRRLGQPFLCLMEEMGGPVPIGTNQTGLCHDPSTAGECSDLLQAPDHQRGGRGTEQ
jgi:transposase